MSRQDRQTGTVIKRITILAPSGHHGGAWKVAYADFVTAMMAFFLLMWLLNATTEKQRAGLADYFSPTVVRTLSGSGGRGSTRGDGTGQPVEMPSADLPEKMAELNRHIQDRLAGIGAESMQMQNILRHVVTRVTDEGLVIELGDLVEEPLFAPDSAMPTDTLRQLAQIVARVLSRTGNDIAVTGHVRSYPVVLAESPVWDLSSNRADAVRGLLQDAGFQGRRVQRVTGYADRLSMAANPAASSNNRIEVILLN